MIIRSKHFITAALVGIGMVLTGCMVVPPAPVAVLDDGEQALPNYKSAGWKPFLLNVQRPDAKQVRDIYMNDVAASATQASGFAHGSTLVMENYEAVTNPDGTLAKGADGKLVKGKLVAIFVHGKNVGWGQKALDALKNGNWIYTAYTPTGAKGSQDLNTCRACHLPLKDKDFVHRYDEFFAQAK